MRNKEISALLLNYLVMLVLLVNLFDGIQADQNPASGTDYAKMFEKIHKKFANIIEEKIKKNLLDKLKGIHVSSMKLRKVIILRPGIKKKINNFFH